MIFGEIRLRVVWSMDNISVFYLWSGTVEQAIIDLDANAVSVECFWTHKTITKYRSGVIYTQVQTYLISWLVLMLHASRFEHYVHTLECQLVPGNVSNQIQWNLVAAIHGYNIACKRKRGDEDVPIWVRTTMRTDRLIINFYVNCATEVIRYQFGLKVTHFMHVIADKAIFFSIDESLDITQYSSFYYSIRHTQTNIYPDDQGDPSLRFGLYQPLLLSFSKHDFFKLLCI